MVVGFGHQCLGDFSHCIRGRAGVPGNPGEWFWNHGVGFRNEAAGRRIVAGVQDGWFSINPECQHYSFHEYMSATGVSYFFSRVLARRRLLLS